MAYGGYEPSTLMLYAELISMQREIPFEHVHHGSVLTDPNAGLRVQLLRAGAAWLIAWAGLILLLDKTRF